MVTASDGGPAPKRSVNVRSGPPLAAVALCGLLLAGPASALFPGWHDDDGADEVGVGIFVLNLGGIDALAGTFEVDFYLYYTGDEGHRLDVDKAQAYFPNAVKGLVLYEMGKMPRRENSTTQFRVQSKFYFSSDNSVFPFERHHLEIAMEDPFKTVDEMAYIADNYTTGMSQSIHFPGFARTSLTQHMYVSNFTYPSPPDVAAKTFSRLTYVMDLTRPYSNGIMKGVLPPFLLLLVLSFNTLLPLKHITNRITVAGSVLVSAVMYHANLENQTPPTGKLSIADEIMISTYFLITVNFSGAIVILLLSDRDHIQRAMDVQWVCVAVQWICTPLTFVFAMFTGQPAFMWIILIAGCLCVFVVFAKRLPVLRYFRRLDLGSDPPVRGNYGDLPDIALDYDDGGGTPQSARSSMYVPLQRRGAAPHIGSRPPAPRDSDDD
mmetsp:Transcript_46372/g.115973  ORF Transcript_46372/g.115973 Transcript_46372/m.115973 type:complete len:436 (-) Transcript_46372:142-1449(-)|eukprot:jgi/Tetstr1/436120/TSEL_024967.t1